MKKYALKVFMKIYERKYPLLAQLCKNRKIYENALYELRHSRQESALFARAAATSNQAYAKLRQLNNEAAEKIPEKTLEKYEKMLDKYIFICYN